MKKPLSLLVMAVFLTQNLPVLYAVENATVKSVRVSAESVYIATDKPVKYRAFIMGTPPKLVVELMGARLKTLEDIPVNGSLLKRVRTGQFQTSPVSISRVVLELSQKAAYEITREGEELVVMLGGRPAQAKPAVKDTQGGAAPAGVTVITPSDSAAPAKPVELKMEPARVLPEDLSRESVPVITPKKTQPAHSPSRSIMESLSREPISFDYNEASVREVIGMMAAKAGVNVIYSDDVSGSITINLNRVPFDEAFKTILDGKGLTAQQVGDNILRIATPQTFMAEQKKAMLQTRIFFLNYSKAAEVKVQVEAVTAAENRTAHCVVDLANNALIITDTPMGLEGTARLLKNLDRVPKQVMIEVKLVEVTLDNSFELGVDWNFANKTNGTSGEVYMAGPTPGAGTMAGSFTLGKVLANSSFNAVISAAVKKNKAKILSDPKVATLNNKEASIDITDQTSYDQQTVTNVSGVNTITHAFSNVVTGITLKVTPTINSDGRITMHIVPSVSQPSAGLPGAPPNVATRGTDTNVVVRDGETIVIGGLIHDNQADVVYKIPILGDIPLLGYVFRKKSVTRTRVELLIFVTPTVIAD
ncbi:MAG: AMIN domain-containing protein [Elusimicrobia bacterium]|nr:AMIN domain-containing protein [Elusimicrobiota bacterium]